MCTLDSGVLVRPRASPNAGGRHEPTEQACEHPAGDWCLLWLGWALTLRRLLSSALRSIRGLIREAILVVRGSGARSLSVFLSPTEFCIQYSSAAYRDISASAPGPVAWADGQDACHAHPAAAAEAGS